MMTINFVTRRRAEHTQEATKILAQEYDHIRVARMPHNARETSAVMRRRQTT